MLLAGSRYGSSEEGSLWSYYYGRPRTLPVLHGVDMTLGSGKSVNDVHGRKIKEDFTMLAGFYQNYKTRESATHIAERGEVPLEKFKESISTWAEGVL
ncbi:hypothetical protein CLAFUW4_02321 [Fulvia fulva]|uniref:Uncharacterized protein n=1 Tax=Passalora fulva TaxID=5499 RepID=A0A9Q8LA66_PASFU|nr:uncharacterized protein CLAFUR5_02310 [Fulvia fulva]KAK4637112.1 hypothetical protein CLAFUR0_02320 [Fulvia fulva]UJO12998.1 hypothetical protein CLAFUR5_02310 [Fulvia fulva]WPV10282.1 hypothetical protein CLAFUW4_02321 [Fulvia fulva]